uniref:Uncharacterized protein n=1 Tax=Solanum lycopersicum TaxID=4081 RepID=A0A3Q7EJ00_SOLLC
MGDGRGGVGTGDDGRGSVQNFSARDGSQNKLLPNVLVVPGAKMNSLNKEDGFSNESTKKKVALFSRQSSHLLRSFV